MIIYDGHQLTCELESVSFVDRHYQETRHYVQTARSRVVDSGRGASELSLTAIVRGDVEFLRFKGWQGDKKPRRLQFNGVLYRDVTTGSEMTWTPGDDKVWLVKMTFIITNPTPHDPVTGEVLI